MTGKFTKKIIIFVTSLLIYYFILFLSGRVIYLLAFLFYFLNFFEKKCNFLCQNFGISKICTIFAYTKNTK